MRYLQQVINAQSTKDGDGVSIYRLAGRRLHDILNPFLMIDEMNSDNADDYLGGFPEHPHRGFEAITYMKAGRMRHRDHMGNEGIVGAGDVQWMMAGAGVLHSEMPEQDQGLLHGFQIWLNLPAAQKMSPAAYREVPSNTITTLALPTSGVVRVIAGEVMVNQQLQTGCIGQRETEPVLIDVELTPGESVTIEFNASYRALVYVYSGSTDTLNTRQMGVYSTGSTLTLTAGESGVKLLVLSGKPLSEPVVQYGPFVMNTTEEIERALQDFQDKQFIRELQHAIVEEA